MSDSFSADWLSLRQSADDAARDHELMAAFCAALPAQATIMDLGAGTGATCKAMAPLLPDDIQWVLVEQDPALIERGQAELAQALPEVSVRYIEADLSTDLATLPLEQADGVTCSALLDLAGAPWLKTLADRLATHNLPMLAMLTYDGMIEWRPFSVEDHRIVELFNIDMRRDKGLGGPASGARACATFMEFARTQGFECRSSRSDWHLDSSNSGLAHATHDGIVEVARTIFPGIITETWSATRSAQFKQNKLELIVGHQDILALPPRK